MQILKAMIFFSDGTRPPGLCDAIEHAGRLWLVPGWIERRDRAARVPARIIPIDLFRYKKIPPEEGKPMELVVDDGIPIQLFAREIPPELRSKFEVVDRPDIEIPIGGDRIQ
jgi:hypothetical protein